MYEYPATEFLVEEVQHLHAQGIRKPTLREFVLALYEDHPAFAAKLFIRGIDEKAGA